MVCGVSSVVLDGRTLVEGEDYVIDYDEPFYIGGTCKLTVKGVGDYVGSVSAGYEIRSNGFMLLVK